MMEPEEIKRFERHVRTIARKADDAEGLAEILRLQKMLDEEITKQVTQLKSEGYSWAELSAPCGMTRQGMAQRFARRNGKPGTTDEESER